MTPPATRILRRLAPTLLVCAVQLAVSAHSFGAQDEPRDQIYVRNARTQAVSLVTGKVTANGLQRIAMTIDGEEQTFKSELVERIEWDTDLPSYREGRVYSERNLWSDAAAQFRIAAGDAGARELVRAHARLLAAQALLRWGAAEPVHFGEAAEEAGRFLTDYPDNRDVPRARMVEARATWLAGDPKAAADKYQALFKEWNAGSPTPGYDRLTCMRAGLLSARCFLDAGDTLNARTLYVELDGALGNILTAIDPADGARHELGALQHEAMLGEGWSELTAGNHRVALTFFQGKLPAAEPGSDTLRFGATLGLGEALLAGGKTREAQMHFARVSAIDHTDRDRTARALVRLAECAIQLVDPDYRAQSKLWLEVVLADYGDTPWAAPARKLMEKVR